MTSGCRRDLLLCAACAEGAISVTNIWAPESPPATVAEGATSYKTAKIGSHDSVFLLFSPKA